MYRKEDDLLRIVIFLQVLDTRDLTINKVSHGCDELTFTLGKPVSAFGSKLEITLPETQDKT